MALVFWGGKKIKEDTENFLSNLTYIGHLNGLKDDLTAQENLYMGARLAGGEVSEESALAALAAIGIARCANLPVRVLSQGQKRRVALARLWLTEGKLWILDEPFAALDAGSVDVLASRLSQHMSNGGMTIITTHQDVTINAQSTSNLEAKFLNGPWMTVLRRDLLLAFRRRSDVATTLFFFLIVSSLFPLGIGPEPAVLSSIAPGVLWVAALLAGMLSLTRLFATDFADGSLEQMLLAPQPLALLVFAKIFAHWLVCGLPVVLLAPIIGLQYALPNDALLVLVFALLLGTPALSLIGAIGAALTLGVRGSGLLVALLVLPLYIPVLIFGAGAVAASQHGMSAQAHLSLLAACSLLALVLAPYGYGSRIAYFC